MSQLGGPLPQVDEEDRETINPLEGFKTWAGSVGRASTNISPGAGEGGLFESESDAIDQGISTITTSISNQFNQLEPEHQKLLLDSADLIKGAYKYTKENPIDTYILPSAAIHTVESLGKFWQMGHGFRSFLLQNVGIDKGAADKIALGRQLFTGRPFPKVPRKIPGVSITTTPYTKGLNPVQVSKPPTNVTDYADILNIVDGSEYSTFNRSRQIKDFTSGSLRKNSLFHPNRKNPNLMFKTADEIDWTKYGYMSGILPTQVSRASPAMVDEVATSLDEFYNHVDNWISSKIGYKTARTNKVMSNAVRSNPSYWTNPETGSLYESTWNSNERRISIRSVNRKFLLKQQSSEIQKVGNLLNERQIRKMNTDLKEAYEARRNFLEQEIQRNDIEIDYYSQPSAAYSTNKALASRIAKKESLTNQLQNLIKGEYFTEHGYYLQSEKIRNHVFDSKGVRIHDSTEFSLGDRKNQTPVFDNLNLQKHARFRVIKNRIELAVDSLNDGYYEYPNLVVNYNPGLSGGREYIIRIEKLDTLSVGRDIDGVLSGESILEINYANDIELIDRLSSPEAVKEWLAEHDIHPVSSSESFKPGKVEVRKGTRPTLSIPGLVEKFKQITESEAIQTLTNIFDLRINNPFKPQSFEQKSLDINVPTNPVPPKSKGGRPLGSKNKPKPDQGELDL